MKIPARIDPTLPEEKRLEIRNKEICNKWLDWYDQDMFKTEQSRDLMARLTKEYGLTLVTIYQVLKSNQDLIQFHKGWEKIKRITELKRLRANKINSNKDIVDILDRERIEIEGEKPLIDNSKHLYLTSIKQFIETINQEKKDSDVIAEGSTGILEEGTDKV